VLSSRTESGLDRLVRELASPNSGVRLQAENAMNQGLDIRSPTARLRFERRTVGGGASVLGVRDASLTSSPTLLSYSESQLDRIVAQHPPIGTVRTLGAGMVQGSAGSFFEKWCRRWVLEGPLGKKVVVERLTILQKDNGHINLNAERRSSDGFLSEQGEVWDMKFLQTSGQIDRDQLRVYKAMQREGLVVTPDEEHHNVKSINYLFQDKTAADANAFAADTVRDVRIWYINDDGWITLLH
jgi:hypothetical protein